jgi:hypothetical protein
LSGRESGREPHSPETASPDSLEVVAGFQHQKLEGWIPELATPEEILAALEQAFDYRGDVSITRKDGSKIEGYIFDRRQGKSLADSFARILPKTGGGKVAVSYADVAALEFTGRDMAAGKGWENWVKQYWEKKAAGETNISLQPEELE